MKKRYTFKVTDDQAAVSHHSNNPIFAIQGTPGIGKSTFIDYLYQCFQRQSMKDPFTQRIKEMIFHFSGKKWRLTYSESADRLQKHKGPKLIKEKMDLIWTQNAT